MEHKIQTRSAIRSLRFSAEERREEKKNIFIVGANPWRVQTQGSRAREISPFAAASLIKIELSFPQLDEGW